MFITSTQCTQPFFFSNNAIQTTHLIMLTFATASNTSYALMEYVVARIIMQNNATTRPHTHWICYANSLFYLTICLLLIPMDYVNFYVCDIYPTPAFEQHQHSCAISLLITSGALLARSDAALHKNMPTFVLSLKLIWYAHNSRTALQFNAQEICNAIKSNNKSIAINATCNKYAII